MPRIYWSSYSDERLTTLAHFVKTQPNGAQVWCVFDNTASGAAFSDALRFPARSGSAVYRLDLDWSDFRERARALSSGIHDKR